MNSTNRFGQPSPGEPAWDATHMLDVHILDYLKKRNLHETASSFKQECKVSENPRALDAPAGFLYEWWSIFWDIYIARTNPAFSEYASTYSEAQKAKAPLRQQQQQLQQLQVQQLQQQMQQSMLQQQLMREKNLQPEHAAQLAQHIASGRIRVSELGGLASLGSQEHMLAKLQDNQLGAQQHPPFQSAGKPRLDDSLRDSISSLASPSLDRRPNSVDPVQRQQLLAAFQASQRSGNQSVMGNNQTLNQMLGGATPQNPLANLATNPPNPWPTLGHSLTQRDSLPTGVGPSLMSPHGIPPELQQQALQKLQQQQGADQGGLHRGMSGDLSMQPGSSRQSSATMQCNFQLPSLPAQASQLNPKQLMLLQQHMQQQGHGMGSQQQQQMLDPDAQRQLLAQLGSRGLLKAGPRYDAFGLGSGIPGQDAAAAAAALHNPLTGQQQQQQEQQRLIAELRAHHHHQQQQGQQQARSGGPGGTLSNTNPKLGPGDRSTPSIMEVDRQIASSDSGHNRNSPANSTAAGSSLQNGRQTPATISSGPRKNSRPNGGKPASGLGNKKRKHSASTSPGNSGSQETPSSHTSRGSGSRKGTTKQPSSSSSMQPMIGQVSMPAHWMPISLAGDLAPSLMDRE